MTKSSGWADVALGARSSGSISRCSGSILMDARWTNTLNGLELLRVGLSGESSTNGLDVTGVDMTGLNMTILGYVHGL